MPICAEVMEIIDIQVYDTLGVPIGEKSTSHLFRHPVGMEVEGKVKIRRDTNMFFPKTLPCPQRAFITRMLCAFLRQGVLTSPFSDSVWTRSCLEFWIGQKLYLQGPSWTFCHPACLLGTKDFSAMLKANDRAKVLESICKPLRRPLIIESGEVFSAEVNVDDNNDPSLEFVLILEGELYRAVQ